MEKFRSLRDSWKAARRSARIDDLIEGEAKELEKTHNVLLLGAHALSLRSPTPNLGGLGLSGSGKSTILKQIRIAYQGGFSHDARMTYREAIYSNLLESAQAAAAALHRFGVAPADPSNVVSSSPGRGTLVLTFNPVPCSKHWNSCWNTISMRGCFRQRVRSSLPSRVNLWRLYTVSGKTKQSQNSHALTGHSSTL